MNAILWMLGRGKTLREVKECTNDLKKFYGYQYENTRLNIGIRDDALATVILKNYSARVIAKAFLNIHDYVSKGLDAAKKKRDGRAV